MALGPVRVNAKRSVIPMSAADSTAAECKRRDRVRPYVRSSTHKLRWTRELHESFMCAVDKLGGQDRATPKRIVKLMDRPEVTISHVKSHLQMCRMGKINAEGMPVNADDPVLFKPISKAMSKGGLSSAPPAELSSTEQGEVYMALQLLKEGRVTGAAGAQKLLKGLADYKRFTTLAPGGNNLPPSDRQVTTLEFIPAVHDGRKPKTEDDVELDLTIAPTLLSPKFQFPSPASAEEATLSLGLSVVR